MASRVCWTLAAGAPGNDMLAQQQLQEEQLQEEQQAQINNLTESIKLLLNANDNEQTQDTDISTLVVRQQEQQQQIDSLLPL